MAAAAADSDEWEICNDNGFVYKCRRRLCNEISFQSPPPSASRNHHRDLRTRKKKALISLKRKYQSELRQWQQLSDSLTLISTNPPSPAPPQSEGPPPSSPSHASVSPEIEELMLQVEGQEAILGKSTELCDYVDAICDAEEERMVKELMDLPIWKSPRCLVASLTSLLRTWKVYGHIY